MPTRLLRRIRRPVVGVLLLGAALGAAGCTDGDAPPVGEGTRTPPSGTHTPETDQPSLLLAHDHRVSVYRNGELEEVGSVGGTATLAIDAGEAGVVVEEVLEEDPRRSRLVLLEDGEPEPLDTAEADVVNLFDVARVEGEPHVLYGTVRRGEGREPEGDVLLEALDSGDRTRVTAAAAPEFGVYRASYADGIIVTSATVDLTEAFGFYRPDGTALTDRPNPTEDLPYNAPPFMAHAVLGPTGEVLAYLEGPDFEGGGAGQERVGEWELVLLDLITGDERQRIRVAPQEEEVVWLDFDGRWAVVSRAERTEIGVAGGDPLPVLVVDTRAEDAAPEELTDVVGRASLAS